MPVAKRFTIEEANALIPRLELLIEQMQRATFTLRSAIQDAQDPESPDASPSRTTADALRLRPDLADQVRKLELMVGEIGRLGCQFKGLDLGLVDFPTQVDGTTVLLCWQYGEKHIAYWHRTDEGFAGRRALSAAEPPFLQ